MTALRGRRGHARVVIFTIIDAEFAAAKHAFGATAEIGTSGVFTDPSCSTDPEKRYPFVVAQSPDRSNTPASGGVIKLLERYRPEYVVVAGIGGGIKRENTRGKLTGPEVGDVVVGRYVHYAPYVKSLPDGRSLRYISLDQPASHLVAQHAQTLVSEGFDRCFDGLATKMPGRSKRHPKVHVGEVIAIESIASNPAAEEQIAMLDQFDNADVVDMESMGVGRALHDFRETPYYNPTWIAIRGISDIVTADRPPLSPGGAAVTGSGVLDEEDNDAQRRRWKAFASATAAVFARNLVARLLSEERPPSDADLGAPSWAFTSASSL